MESMFCCCDKERLMVIITKGNIYIFCTLSDVITNHMDPSLGLEAGLGGYMPIPKRRFEEQPSALSGSHLHAA